ncbi:uncharacterized protein LOC130965690 [Arachis stenosperma]|uniref:uncharacterized protein LOC130965690 n=1 Tax=Arachis stenosperma TaxID=217475 RepID=UPI0025AD828E|nr:uncharacterized protein LOC130965690 [Arachis stenosperma]
MEIVPVEKENTPIQKSLYKETLLTGPGLEENPETSNFMDDDEPNPEDKWYKDDEDVLNGEKSFNPCPTIPVSKEEFEEWCKPWKNTLMVKVLGKRVTFAFMKQRLQRDWEGKGKIHVIDMNRDYFLVHFSDEEYYNHALMEGPWMVAGHYLIVQRWRPFFLSGSTEARKIAAWIRIPNLPIELYNHRFLWRVGSAIGHMLKIDRTTSIHSRGKFARICVEIDLTKQLVPRISVLGCELHLKYEGLYQICFSCGRYGHRSEPCTENPSIIGDPLDDVGTGTNLPMNGTTVHGDNQNRKFEEPQNQHKNDTHGNGQNNPDFGPWVMVKRYSNKKKIQIGQRYSHENQKQVTKNNYEKDEVPTRKDPDGSRFTILHKETSEDAQVCLERGDKTHKEIEVNGLPQTQAQHEMVNSPIQKKVLRHRAGKNPQNQKKALPLPKGLSDPGRKPNHNKNKEKNPIIASPNPKGLAAQPKAVEGKGKESELEGMELMVKEYMKRMEREKWEAFNSSKNARMMLDQHVVRENMLFNTEMSHYSLDERAEIGEPKGNQVKKSDVLMIEAGSRDSIEETSSRGRIGPDHGAPARKGTGSKAFPSIIRDLRQEYEANFFFLLETHVSGSRGKQIRDKIGFDKSFVVDAMGHSGGIWCLWDSSVWNVDVLDHDRQYVHLQVSGKNSISWLLIAVYGSPQRVTRRALWNSLEGYARNVNLPWCLLGDFNAMLHDYKKHGGTMNNNQSACREFQECISNSGLVDLGYSGWPFTWKIRNHAERLDRGLSNLEWQISFPEAYVKHLPMLKSDHSPIVPTHG